MAELPCRRCRTLLVTLAVAASVIVALIAGGLAKMAGQSMPVSVMAGGGAFATTTLVVLALLGALGWFASRD